MTRHPAAGLAVLERAARNVALCMSVAGLAGCASAVLTDGGTLSSNTSLTPSAGVTAKSDLRIDKDRVRLARTVRILPTRFPQTAAPALSDQQRRLVGNAVDRALCVGLSDRFEVRDHDRPADLVVHVAITEASPTNEIAAGLSAAVAVVPKVLGAPVPVPRIPIGLGSLTVEAEAIDQKGVQVAAMIWAHGANSFTSSPVVSEAGDAYEAAAGFGGDFSGFLKTGESPFGKLPTLPSADTLAATFGGKPKMSACEAFGRGPGVPGMVARRLGLPPEWTDKGAAPPPGG